VIDEHNNVLLANRAYYNGFKLTPAQVEDRPIREILPVEELLKAISLVSTGRESQVQLEFRYGLDDSERIVVAQVLSMKNRRALIMLTDITEERGHQQKLHLADRLASVGEMAAGISHELNNPLTNILLMSQLLIEDEIPDAVKEELLLINKEAKRASSVVKNMLTFARKRDAVKQPSQVNSIIADVIKLRAYEHRVNNIEIAMELDAGLPDILLDYFQIQQVFLNIILNAEQVMIESSGKGKLTVSSAQINGNISIKFADDGPGIKDGNMSHIFDPFFTTKEVGKGTGLGLSICYGIIRSHNGRIYAESEPGRGATFTVELPVLNGQRTGARV
jgi:signal transduction histidine kinase